MPRRKLYYFEGRRWTVRELSETYNIKINALNKRLLRFKKVSIALDPGPCVHKEHYMRHRAASNLECEDLQKGFAWDEVCMI